MTVIFVKCIFIKENKQNTGNTRPEPLVTLTSLEHMRKLKKSNTMVTAYKEIWDNADN